jgi:deoxyribodipyrimidine photolyase
MFHIKISLSFWQGLRLHDNPALLAALQGADHVYPIFILDPHFLKPDRCADAQVAGGSLGRLA